MLYYKVIKGDKLFRRRNWIQTVTGELFTPAEVERYSKPDKYGDRLKADWLEPVQVPKNKTYWFFGARRDMRD